MTSTPHIVERLKACAHCASEAEMREWDWPYPRFQARCSICKAHASARLNTREKAIAAWNLRAPDPVITAYEAALTAFADGAEKCSQSPHFIVQPFLAIFKEHGDTIAKARLSSKGTQP